jgi:hypothetical protein
MSFHAPSFRFRRLRRRFGPLYSRAITARTSGHTGPRISGGAKAILRGTGRFPGGRTCGHAAVAKDALGENGGNRLPTFHGREIANEAVLAHRQHLPAHPTGRALGYVCRLCRKCLTATEHVVRPIRPAPPCRGSRLVLDLRSRMCASDGGYGIIDRSTGEFPATAGL